VLSLWDRTELHRGFRERLGVDSFRAWHGQLVSVANENPLKKEVPILGRDKRNDELGISF